MAINKVTKNKYRKGAHKNFMDGDSYKINDPIKNLRLAASSCFFGEPQYYRSDGTRPQKARGRTLTDDEIAYLNSVLGENMPAEWVGKSPSEMMELAIDNALDADIEATLQEAVRLRNEEHIRTTPQVILVRAANHKNAKGTGLIRKYASKIVQRADEPAVCMAYQLSTYGRKAIPNSLKRALADKLESFDEYRLAKYRMENRFVKTVDVINLVHPRSTNAINKLINGELKLDSGQTWEAIRSAGGSWEDALAVMGHMALLRNLRNLKDVSPDKYLKRLLDGVKAGKQLPFRYYSAYKACKDSVKPIVLDTIEECLEISLDNIPHFSGKTMSLCDNSGSAWGSTTSSMGTMHVAEIANLTAVITGKVSDEGYIGIFGDRLKVLPIRKKSSVFDQVDNACNEGRHIGGATENGIWLFWRDAIRKRQHWDNVFVFSDMQAGHGGLYGRNAKEYKEFGWPRSNRNIDVAKLINAYRSTVNPDVNVFLVQVAGYQDTIVPEFFRKTYILGGWGDGLLRFAKSMIEESGQ